MNSLHRCPSRLRPFRWLPAALAVLAGSAGAAVVCVDLSGSPVAIPDTLDGLYLNLAAGSVSTGDIPLTGWDINFYNAGSRFGFFTPAGPAGQGLWADGSGALALLGGETIGPDGLYASGQARGLNFLTTGIRFAGFRFFNENTGTLNYGWVLLANDGSTGNGFPAHLLAFGYDDTGEALTAGPVPEPSTFLMLILSGLAGLSARYRSRGNQLR